MVHIKCEKCEWNIVCGECRDAELVVTATIEGRTGGPPMNNVRESARQCYSLLSTGRKGEPGELIYVRTVSSPWESGVLGVRLSVDGAANALFVKPQNLRLELKCAQMCDWLS
jgi:hypothetical protein